MGGSMLSDERYEEIKQIVVEHFKKYNISCVPVNGYEMVKKMGIKMVFYSSLCDKKIKASMEISKDGFSLYDGQKWIIYINDLDYNYTRTNNTIIHEVAHIVLNHSEDSELADKEANFFAKYSLAPPILILRLNLHSIKEIEKTFEISHSAAVYA